MSSFTLTRSGLATLLAHEIGVTRQVASRYVSHIIDAMFEGIIDDQVLKLSSFGTFMTLKKNDRVGRNPKTGEEVMIEPRHALSFRPSLRLRNLVDPKKKSNVRHLPRPRKGVQEKAA